MESMAYSPAPKWLFWAKQSVLNKLSKSERAGWEWLVTKGSAKSSEYAAGMKVDERTARRHLNQFLKLGLARKSGASTSTEYEIPC